jgi:two-component system, chemotaxis family, CheB/CheR fusion protein
VPGNGHSNGNGVETETQVRRLAIDGAPVAQIVVDSHGEVMLANAHARTLFGIKASDVGRPIQELEVSYRPIELRSRIQQAYAERHPDVTRFNRLREEAETSKRALETANEELQSTNEELETMNDELEQRTDELNDVNAFLESVLGSLGAAVAVVDRDLQVTAWNDAAFELWGLRLDEVLGKHFLNLDNRPARRPAARTDPRGAVG